MKRSIVLTALLLAGVVLGYAQTAEELFKQKFPKIGTQLDFKADAELSKDEVKAYRAEYIRLNEALEDIEKQKLDVATEENLQVFTEKELKNLSKDEQLNKMEELVHSKIFGLKDYMKDKTKYGVDSVECIQNLSILKTLTDQKDYNSAYKPFKLLFNSYPISSTNVYSKGEDVLEYKMKQAHNKAAKISKSASEDDSEEERIKKNKEIKKYLKEKREWFDTLQMLYDQRIKYFGDRDKYGEGYVRGKKGYAYYKYYKDSAYDTAYVNMKQSVQLEKEDASHSVILYYFASAIEMLKNKRIGSEEIIQDYILADNAIEGKIKKSREYIERKPDSKTAKKLKEKAIPVYMQISEKITEIFIKCPCSSCEVLDSIFSEKYDTNKDNPEWLKRTTDLLEKKGCNESDFYEKAVIALYEAEPSAESAFKIAQLMLKKKKYGKAGEFYEKAYSQETDSLLKSKYLYGAALLERLENNFSKARSLALEAAKLRPNWGEPYLLIAKMYAASAGSCGSDGFEHLMTYWAAADKAIYARSIDDSEEVQKEANQLISAYSSKFPNSEEGFMREINEGDAVTIGCWINETTTARY